MSFTRWRTSSRSTNNANCVEVCHAQAMVGLRDAKNSGGPVLAFPRHSFQALLRSWSAERCGDLGHRGV
ncbi:MAG TPA: DUF397 domain-containing protein [Actinophytocola sp.]|uniref:DUF397 domain-containing protein n=1 Tax=Actinophytocola sp. TaxID=1872138 RepID=UPI002DBE22E4|nr:DUF397 domain-containing protein [Actinophytocola sp.]HEU5472055.1 DUF397 domain-containing protein [Actinophytocola sp.]